MKRSTTDLKRFTTDPDASLPYTVSESMNIQKMDYFDIAGMAPAGSINSSVNDMSAWLKVWVNGGKFNDTQLIPSTFYQEAIGSQMVINSGIPSKFDDLSFSNYGLAWMLHSYRGHFQVEHGGNIDGFSASVSFFPTDSIGIVVLSNQDGSIFPKIVSNIIADKLLGIAYRDWNGIAKKEMAEAREQASKIEMEQESSKVKNTIPSHDLNAYAGTYFHPAYGNIEITNVPKGLEIKIGDYTGNLTHYHYDYFEVSKRDSTYIPMDKLKVSFETGVDGKIAELKVQFDETGEVSFEHKEKTVALSTDDLKKYIGDYDLSGTTVTVSVKNNVLFVFVPGQTDYETTSVGNHTFLLNVAKGYSLVFGLNPKNEVETLSFVQPNGTFKAIKK